MTEQEFMDAESCMSRSAGHCMTMGTASTMACMVESLGLTLPGNAAIPAVDSRRRVLAQETGRRIVQMVHEDLRISKILKREAFRKRHPRQRRHRRLYQRRHSPHRVRRPRGRAADAGRLGPATAAMCAPSSTSSRQGAS